MWVWEFQFPGPPKKVDFLFPCVSRGLRFLSCLGHLSESRRRIAGIAMATSFEPVTGLLKAQFADFELDLSSGELIREGHRFRLQGQPSLWGFLSGRHVLTSLG